MLDGPSPNFSVYLHMCFVNATLEHECPKTFETSWGAPAFTTSPNCCSMHGTQQTIILDGARPVWWDLLQPRSFCASCSVVGAPQGLGRHQVCNGCANISSPQSWCTITETLMCMAKLSETCCRIGPWSSSGHW